MLGMAQKLFKTYTNHQSGMDFHACKTALHEWPYLEYLIDFYALNPVDLRLAETLLKKYPINSESVAALICHLSLATRNGHLMIKIEGNQVLPSIHSLWKKEADIKDEDVNKLEMLILNGIKELSENPIFNDLLSKNKNGFVTTSLCQFENMFYFQRYFNFETKVLEHFTRLQRSEPSLKFDEQQILNTISELLENKTLLKEQALAVLMASRQSLTLICGGPGTGKTYTAGFILKVLLDSLPNDKKDSIKIAIAAPTGKAASNLQKSLKSSPPHCFKAKTLHQLLGIRGDGKLKNERQQTLHADIVVIDESSMIDVAMMGHLLSAIESGTRIIFLGDKHQLPSVDAGSMFADMVSLSLENSVTLQTCLRAELQEIVDFGKAINEGNAPKVFEMLSQGVAVKRLELEIANQENLFQYAASQFPVILKENATFTEILESFDNFRILSPLRKGHFGVDALNHFFFHQLVKKPLKKHSVTIPIMLLRNDSNLDLFNGEVGVLILAPRYTDLANFHALKGDYALFPCKKNGFRKFPALVLPAYEFAYVLSVHKAQGSEFNHVLCLLPEGAEHFGKEVLYTAVTRARQSLIIYGNDKTLENTIKNQSERLSGLKMRSEYASKNCSFIS